jgi:ABC-type transporter Mla maintaining outer membrane lipid asymmetry ATPase subunit MlaF/ABC-type transporter Mla maintaining outer membrane lipid asymmetry permease subunit MlaE
MANVPDELSLRAGTLVEFRDLTVHAGTQQLLEGASAEFSPGQVTLIVGSSGAGKSVLLRILAGLITPGHPEFQISGKVLFGRGDLFNRDGEPEVGVVFQNFALFDELSPLDNVRLAQAHRSRSSPSMEGPLPAKLLRELRVPSGVATASLSGGQRQRLAIARTLAYDPAVILYDEPTSGLDAATAETVAKLIQSTHATHPKTSIIVTHDYEALAPIADRIYLLDPETRSLRRIDQEDWPSLRGQLKPAAAPAMRSDPAPDEGTGWRPALRRWTRGLVAGAEQFFSATTQVVEATLTAPLRLAPVWKSPVWGFRYLCHYLRLVMGLSAWIYIAVAGAIAGFVTTYFTFRFLPYASYTEPLLIEDLLTSIGFALYRVLVPILATILIAARCGAAVASDVGGKSYGQQIDALRTFGIRPERYLLTGTLYAFLLGTPVLTLIGFYAARVTSLIVFTALQPERGPLFWELHFHRELLGPDQLLYQGTGWLLAKTLVCAAGIGLIAYHQGAQAKLSGRDVSRGITTTILWATLYVLLVHFGFAFHEFNFERK